MPNTSSIYYQVYALLDKHPLAETDCGELCGKLCCCYMVPEDQEEGVELLPGEEEVFPLEAGWHKPGFLPGSMYEYPPEWGRAGCVQIRCLEPCPRGERPVNCRLFPFQIYTREGRYYLVLIGAGYYNCPLTSRPELLNKAFIETAKEAAGLLLSITKVRQLIDFDSKKIDRENIKIVTEL